MYQNKAGFQAYINKPVRLENLLEQIQRCVDVQWCDHEVSTHQSEAVADITPPPPDVTFNTLMEYAKIGYLKGVCECIEKIESLHPSFHLVRRLRELANSCDLDAIVRTIEELEASTEPC